MDKYFIVESFELHEGQLENWKKLSKDIDDDLADVEGFISRDSGIDESNRVYCLVKWENKTYQENFRKQLESRENWGEMMAYFGSIANMKTEKGQEIDLF